MRFSLGESRGDAENAEKKRNALSALNALDKVLVGGKGTVSHFYHREIGKIRLDWGFAGTPQSGYSTGGYGVDHIIARRLAEGRDVQEVVQTLVDVLVTASTGKIVSKNRQRIELTNRGVRAIIGLTWNEKQENWVVSGFKDDTDAQERALRLSKGYAPVDFVHRQEVGAASRNFLSQLIAKVKADEVKFSLSEDGAKLGLGTPGVSVDRVERDAAVVIAMKMVDQLRPERSAQGDLVPNAKREPFQRSLKNLNRNSRADSPSRIHFFAAPPFRNA